MASDRRGNHMHRSIQDAMTPNPTAIEAGTPAQEAARTMKSEDVVPAGGQHGRVGERLWAVAEDYGR